MLLKGGLLFLVLLAKIEAKLQGIAITGQLLCASAGHDFYDPDLRVSLVDHDYFSRDDVLAEGYFPNGTVNLGGASEEYFKIVPKMWIDHQCGMDIATRPECYTRAEIFIGGDYINKVYDFGQIYLDPGMKPYRNIKIKCEGRRKNPNKPSLQEIENELQQDPFLHP